jgi:CubicO group peptidase (beta-lactamase class C family)
MPSAPPGALGLFLAPSTAGDLVLRRESWHARLQGRDISSRGAQQLSQDKTMPANRKKTLAKIAIALVLTTGSIYLFAPWQFALHYLYPLPATIEAQVAQAVDQGLDGIIIYVDNIDGDPEAYAAGWHNRETRQPANPDALFKIGSIRKLYLASAIAKLVADGTISLDRSLADYLPELKGRIEYADSISLRMMVQHRSGIPNYTDAEGFDWGEEYADVLDLVIDRPADFEPDTGYAYSNTNYLLLGRIMNRALGYDHEEYIRQALLEPFGLSNTYLSVTEIVPERLMSGYHVGYAMDFKMLDQGYVATAQDVAVFVRALNDGSLFTDEERQIYSSLYEYGHKGWVLGHSSTARYHSDIDAVVVQFVNTTGNDTVLLTSIVYHRILRILRARQSDALPTQNAGSPR